MLIQPSRKIPKDLREPEIPGRTEPQLPSGEWGINYAAALGNFTNGLKVHVLPYTDMGLGDGIELQLDGVTVDQQTLTQTAQLGQRVTLWVEPRHSTNGSHTLGYTIKRAHQTPEPYKPPVAIYIKLDLPGGQDLDPDPGQHSELYQYIDPRIIADGVDKETARNGVKIIIKAKPGSLSKRPYPNCAAGDVIIVSWGGVRIRSAPVTQAQVDDPDAHPIEVNVTEADILRAGDSGPLGVPVTFTILDLVNNAAQDWCSETRIVVDTGNSRLNMPILEQANGQELHLETLKDEDLELRVWATSPDFQESDVIIMYINGSTLDGVPVAHDARQTINKEPPLVVSVFLPNSAARELAKTQAVFFYELERGGAVIQRSKSLFITIIGDPYRLAAPIADDAVDGALKPDLEHVSIRIPHDDRFEEDMGIELKWLGTQADSITYDPQLDLHILSATDASNPLGFIVKVDGVRHLKLLKGGTLDLSYNLLSDEDGVVVRRASQHAELLTVGEAQLELVPPIVQGEENGILEPRDLPDGTSKITCPNPLANPTKPQDVVTWLLRDANGALLDEGSKTLNALTAGRPVDFPLDAAFVQKHFEARRGEKLSVSYSILRFETGKTSYSNPLVFTVGVALELLAPSIKENNGDSALNPLLVRDTLTIVVPDNPELRPNDEIIVTWTGADGTPAGGSHTSVPRAVSAGLEFAIPNSVVAFNLGKQVKVSYVVIIDGHPTPSRVFDLTVQAMPQSALASPTIEQADNDGAGPELYTGDLTQASVRMGDWPLIALGQYVWLRLHGTNADGSAYVREIWSAPTAFTNDDWIADGFFTFPLPADELKALQDGSGLSEEFKAALSQNVSESEALVFPVRNYKIKAEPPKITGAKDSKGNPILEGGTTPDTTITLTGTAVKGSRVRIKAAGYDREVTADPSSDNWSLTITGLSTATHRFTAQYAEGNTSTPWVVIVSPIILSEDFEGLGSPSDPRRLDIRSMTIERTPVEPGVSIRIASSTNYEPPMRGEILHINGGNTIIRFEFKATYSYISFNYAHTNALGTTARFYDSNGTQLGERALLTSSIYKPEFAEFQGAGIQKMIVTTGPTAIAFDNFIFRL